MKPLDIKQETLEERVSRLEKTLVTIYAGLPVFIKSAICSQSLPSQGSRSRTVGQLIDDMQKRIEFEFENESKQS